jgi:hypothetical protein
VWFGPAIEHVAEHGQMAAAETPLQRAIDDAVFLQQFDEDLEFAVRIRDHEQRLTGRQSDFVRRIGTRTGFRIPQRHFERGHLADRGDSQDAAAKRRLLREALLASLRCGIVPFDPACHPTAISGRHHIRTVGDRRRKRARRNQQGKEHQAERTSHAARMARSTMNYAFDPVSNPIRRSYATSAVDGIAAARVVRCVCS